MSFPFIRLPGEIRNRIYEYCLCPEKEVIIWAINAGNNAEGAMVNKSHFENLNRHLTLLLTNKQINREATPYFFAKNTFRFLCPSTSEFPCRSTSQNGDALIGVETYLNGLSSERCNMIREILLNFSLDTFLNTFKSVERGAFLRFAKILHTVSNLQHLEVKIATQRCRCKESVKISQRIEFLLRPLETRIGAKISLRCSDIHKEKKSIRGGQVGKVLYYRRVVSWIHEAGAEGWITGQQILSKEWRGDSGYKKIIVPSEDLPSEALWKFGTDTNEAT
ncbi:hypothetical protein MMC08_002560 [Hypocenomyce scalaris]|nr:hypothetical protein [Hypocenomyce scalaris]